MVAIVEHHPTSHSCDSAPTNCMEVTQESYSPSGKRVVKWCSLAAELFLVGTWDRRSDVTLLLLSIPFSPKKVKERNNCKRKLSVGFKYFVLVFV